MTPPVRQLPSWVETALREAADPQRREVTSKYLPTTLEIPGSPSLVAVDRKAVGAFVAAYQEVVPSLARREAGTRLETGRKLRRT